MFSFFKKKSKPVKTTEFHAKERPRPKNQARITDRLVDEMVGICSGITADGVVTQKEAEFLQKWIVANQRVLENPLIEPLFHRINDMLVDNILDQQESTELCETLMSFTATDYELGEVAKSSRLPLDKPLPEVIVEGSVFCFTGTFAYGNRKECHKVVEGLGGTCHPSIIKILGYLVIGTYATDEWAHTAYGRKIEKALKYKNDGCDIKIIGEQYFFENI